MHAKKATYEQRKILNQAKLDPHEWYVQKDTIGYMQVKNIKTEEEKRIDKIKK